MRLNRVVELAILAVTIALLALLVTLRASVEREQLSVPSTFDTGAHGYAALYSLLARERVQVDRFEDPISHIGDRHGALVIAGDYQMLAVAPTRRQRQTLDGWVRGGGTLDLFGLVPFWMRETFGVPDGKRLRSSVSLTGCGIARRNVAISGHFTNGFDPSCSRDRVTLLFTSGRATAIAYRRGKGTVILSQTTTVFDNEHLAQRANAAFAYAVLSAGPVLFEERGYGYVRARSFWQALPVPMRFAIGVALFALALAIAGANIPFAPPYPPPGDAGRDSGEYIASLARMLVRGNAQRAIVQRFCRFVESAVGSRAQSDDRARDLLDHARMLQSLSSPRTEDVIAAGKLFARVRKDYSW